METKKTATQKLKWKWNKHSRKGVKISANETKINAIKMQANVKSVPLTPPSPPPTPLFPILFCVLYSGLNYFKYIYEKVFEKKTQKETIYSQYIYNRI